MLKFRLIGGILILGALLLSACGGIPQDLAMTLTAAPNQISTQAVATFSSDLTLTALAAPTNTATATMTPAPTLTAFATSTGGAVFGSTAPAGTAACYGLAFVSDVTIQDGTAMKPGEKFTKTWRVQNTGSCTWDAGFKFAFVSGDAMGGQTYTLPSPVASGAVTDISIAMTAPSNKNGLIEGDWQMSTASGQAFGTVIFVKVTVGGGAAPTNTGAAPTNTQGAPVATATSTPTP